MMLRSPPGACLHTHTAVPGFLRRSRLNGGLGEDPPIGGAGVEPPLKIWYNSDISIPQILFELSKKSLQIHNHIEYDHMEIHSVGIGRYWLNGGLGEYPPIGGVRGWNPRCKLGPGIFRHQKCIF